MKLVNVRLGSEDARMAGELRRAGIPLSQVVREAIRAEYRRQLGGRPSRRRVAEVMAAIYEDDPDPPNLPPRGYDLRDRRATRRAIVARLGRAQR